MNSKYTGSEENESEILWGRDIYLRHMTKEDTDLIVKWRNEDFVRKNFIYQKPFTREGHLNWIETMVKTGRVIQFMICTKEKGPVGSVYLRDIDPAHRRAEYGIFIGEREAQGCGYGTQAAELVVRYSFERLGLHKLMLRVLADNGRARRSYEKAGFVQEAYLKDEVYLEDGYHDVILMAVLNQEKKRGQEAI